MSQIYTTIVIIIAGPGMDLYFVPASFASGVLMWSFSEMQLAQDCVCLHSGTPEVMILPYQLYSVLMTFVRKGRRIGTLPRQIDKTWDTVKLYIQLQHIATSTDTALSTDHARRHLLADLSCDILLEPVAKLGLWLHDAELSCLRASPGRLDRWLSPSKAWADWNIEVKRCQAFISLQTRPDWSTKTRACSYHGYEWPSSVSVFLRRFLSFAIALEPWKQFCHDSLVLWSIPVGIQSQRCFGIFGGGVGDLQAVPACAFWGVYGLNKYVLWIGACTSVASIKFSVSSRMPCAPPFFKYLCGYLQTQVYWIATTMAKLSCNWWWSKIGQSVTQLWSFCQNVRRLTCFPGAEESAMIIHSLDSCKKISNTRSKLAETGESIAKAASEIQNKMCLSSRCLRSPSWCGQSWELVSSSSLPCLSSIQDMLDMLRHAAQGNNHEQSATNPDLKLAGPKTVFGEVKVECVSKAISWVGRSRSGVSGDCVSGIAPRHAKTGFWWFLCFVFVGVWTWATVEHSTCMVRGMMWLATRVFLALAVRRKAIVERKDVFLSSLSWAAVKSTNQKISISQAFIQSINQSENPSANHQSFNQSLLLLYI